MRGLLSSGPALARLLSAPTQADEADELFLRRYAERGFEGQPFNRPVPPSAPQAQPQRGRVSGWRVLDRVLGGQTISEGIDAERERLTAEAMRPSLEQHRAQLRAIAADMGPAALIAFETNPEKFGENLAEQYSPQVIAAGGVQSVIGNGRTVAAPSFAEFGQEMVRRDPITGAVETVATRGPTFQEETARINANNPINVAPGGRAIDPRTGQVIAEGAPRVFSAGDGAQLYDESGRQIAENVKDVPAVDPAAVAQAEEARLAMATNLENGLRGARQFVNSAGVWSQYNPLNRQNRANLEAHLDTLKGNITFERLAAMKAASPTGGSGLGALSDNEGRLLASTVAALNPDMSAQELERSFRLIDDLVAKMRTPAPGQGGVVTVRTPAEAQALPPGTRYRNPAGQEYIR